MAPVEQLLAAVESVHEDHERCRPCDGLGTHDQAWNERAPVWNLDALAILAAEFHGFLKCRIAFRIGLLATRMAVTLHAFSGQVIKRSALQFRAGRERAVPFLVFRGQLGELVRHPDPFLQKIAGADVGALDCRVAQRSAHLVDLADLRAALERDVDGQVPDVVAREIFEHGHGTYSGCRR
jgi:hypothetical protein